ncbi:MAG TPA: Uma2 family endonuclease [Tepidisphaeraceae bacterium]|nr:Uma2 family endonuclease [Tepidisphaeraceae bacterium]
MSLSTIKMTASQFLELGEDPVGIRLELVDGEIEMSPSPEPKHAFVITRLLQVLSNYIDELELGQLFPDVDTIFGEHDVRRPDIIFFSSERLDLVGERAMEGPPDLCVEVISPSSVATDRKRKFKQYAKGGVAHYWIVDPREKTIEGYKLIGKKYEITGSGKDQDIVRLPPFDQLDISLARLWLPPRR